MATQVLDNKYYETTDYSPNLWFNIDCSVEPTSTGSIKYIFTISCGIAGVNGFLQGGYKMSAKATVNGVTSSTVVFKEEYNDNWEAGSRDTRATFTLTVTCSENSENNSYSINIWNASSYSPNYGKCTISGTLSFYTISYNANGGNSTPDSVIKVKDKTLTLESTKIIKNDTISSSNFTITGNANGGNSNSSLTAVKTTTTKFTHNSWNTLSSGAGTTYNLGGSYTANASDELYAIYINEASDVYSNNILSNLTKPSRNDSVDDEYTVTLNATGGLCDINSLKSYKTSSYKFDCWCSNADGTGTKYTDDTSFESTTTVYAKWNKTTVISSVDLPIPTREGYEFLGWGMAESSTTYVDDEYTPGSDIILYAIWEAKGLANITINGENRLALVLVYHNGKWCQAIPEVYNNGAFKIGI